MQKDGFIDELLAKTDLVKLISEYVRLEKKGAGFWGCCPFHLEKTPSFQVSEDKQLYYCHGACHEGGNAITFIKKIESVDSADAVKILAKRAGLEVPVTERLKRDDAQIIKKKERLYALMKDAARRYHENLKTGAAAGAREYLKNRGIGDKLITKFGLGYSLNGKDIISYLSPKGYSDAEMKDAGITAIGEKASAYDTFYERLMVPIINQFGEVVAFGGRTLVKNPEFAKYKNSAQGLIFDKGKTIYAANLLQKCKQQKRSIDYVILCEGYMDVISLHNAGFDTAVASMGTALTFNQAKQLKNFAGRVYISYDGDTAGQKAALRSLDILDEAGLSVRVVQLPQGLDPDDVIRASGAEYYQKLLNEALPLPAFKIETLKKQYDLKDPEEKSKFAVEAAKIVRSLKNPVEQEEYLQTIRAATGYSMEALRRQTDIAEPAAPVPVRVQIAEEKAESGSGKEEEAKRFVLASVAAGRDYVDFSADFNAFFTDRFSREVVSFFLLNRKEKTASVASLYYRLGEEAEQELSEIIHFRFLDADNGQKYADCVRVLSEAAFIREKAELTRKWEDTKDMGILERIKQIEIKIKQLKNGGEN